MPLVGWRRVAGAGGGRRHGAVSFVKKVGNRLDTSNLFLQLLDGFILGLLRVIGGTLSPVQLLNLITVKIGFDEFWKLLERKQRNPTF